MTKNITVYHNPRCSKSRATVEWLNQQEHEVTVVEYLKNPPDLATLTSVLTKLQLKPLEIMRTGDALFKELDLANDKSEAQLLDALVKHPALLERPIVTTDDSAAIGRPLENIINLIDDL